MFDFHYYLSKKENVLICNGKMNVITNFYYKYSITFNNVHYFQIYEYKEMNGRFFECQLQETGNNCFKLLLIDNDGYVKFKAKGIPDALFKLISDCSGYKIYSSKRYVNDDSERRSDDSNKMWERLRISGHATYDPIEDVYIYIP